MSREPIAKMFKKDLQPAMFYSAQESSKKDSKVFMRYKKSLETKNIVSVMETEA